MPRLIIGLKHLIAELSQMSAAEDEGEAKPLLETLERFGDDFIRCDVAKLRDISRRLQEEHTHFTMNSTGDWDERARDAGEGGYGYSESFAFFYSRYIEEGRDFTTIAAAIALLESRDNDYQYVVIPLFVEKWYFPCSENPTLDQAGNMVHTAAVYLSRNLRAHQIAEDLLPLHDWMGVLVMHAIFDSVPWFGPNYHATQHFKSGTPSPVQDAMKASVSHIARGLGVEAADLTLHLCSRAVAKVTAPEESRRTTASGEM